MTLEGWLAVPALMEQYRGFRSRFWASEAFGWYTTYALIPWWIQNTVYPCLSRYSLYIIQNKTPLYHDINQPQMGMGFCGLEPTNTSSNLTTPDFPAPLQISTHKTILCENHYEQQSKTCLAAVKGNPPFPGAYSRLNPAGRVLHTGCVPTPLVWVGSVSSMC